MFKKSFLLHFTILIGICLIFFYKLFLGQIPFPGDLLVNVEPYKSQSFLGYISGSYPSKAQGADVIYELYPWKYFTIQELKKGHIPFWNPHNFSGNLMMQNFQSAIFYPLNIVYFLFDFNTAWSFLILSQPLLACLFMYLFLREIKISSVSSVIGAIAFAFSAYMAVWMEYGNIDSVLLWLPAVLFLIYKIIAQNKLWQVVAGVGCLTCAILGGYIQGVFYIYLVAFAYTIFLLMKEKAITKDRIVSFLILFFIPIFLASPQLFPTLEFFKRSTRTPYSLSQIETLLNPFYYWITLLVPDFFGHPASRNYWLSMTYIERVMSFGVPLVLFVMIAVASVKNSIKTFFLILGGIILFIGTNLPLVKYIYLIPIPMISTTVPTRVFSIFIFSMIVVAAYGLDYVFAKKENISKKIPVIYISLYILLWLVVLFLPKCMPQFAAGFSVTKRNLLLPTGLALITTLFVLGRKQLKQFALIGVLILVSAELFYSFHKITPFSPRELAYPKTPVMSFLQKYAGINRFWGYGDAYIPPNFQSVDGTYSPEGNDPLHLQTYGNLVASTKTGKIPHLVPRPDANLAPGYGSGDLANNLYRQKILNLLGVSYVLNKTVENSANPDIHTFPEKAYHLVWHDASWQVYKNKEALPRFFLANDFVIEKNDKQALQKIYSIPDLKKTLILSSKPTLPIDKHAKGTVSLITYEPNQVVFRTASSGNTLLFLSDALYSSWSVSIDRQRVPLLKADMTFRAVSIPKGTHTVRFFYSPRYYVVGIYFAALGVLLLVLYIGKRIKK